MEILIFFVAVGFLVLWYYVSREFGKIAEMKGHNSTAYTLWTFFFSAVGMMMVIALPDRRAASPAVQPQSPSQHSASPVYNDLPEL